MCENYTIMDWSSIGMSRLAAASFGLALIVMAGSAHGQMAKDQSRVEDSAPGASEPAVTPPPGSATETPAQSEATPSEPGAQEEGVDLTQPPPESTTAEPISPDDLNLGEIPVIKTIELTADAAKRALDVFAVVREKYKDANLEEYEDLQDFVDQSAQGKAFEADVKTAWFSTVNEWNSVITSVGFAYSAITDDQTAEISLQIEEIKKDTTVAQDMKDKMIASLQAMIPSDNNRKVVQDLMNEPGYADKLALLVEDE
jgi:hypothetical protein